MGLSLEDFQKRSRPGKPCGMVAVFAALNDKDRAVLEQALAAPFELVPHTRVEAVLRDNGHSLKAGQIGRHRRGTCSCAG